MIFQTERKNERDTADRHFMITIIIFFCETTENRFYNNKKNT